MMPRSRTPHARLTSRRARIALITIGTFSSLEFVPASSTVIALTGPFAPEHGLRFDPSKVLLDPYGRAVAVPDGYSRQMASQYGVNDAIAMKSVVVDPSSYDWEGDAPLRRPYRQHGHLRDACRRLHAASELRSCRGAARDLRGDDRKDPVSPGSRDHRRGTAADIPVRPAGLPGRVWSITGDIRRYRSSLLMPATVRARIPSARSTNFVISSRRCTAPVSR